MISLNSKDNLPAFYLSILIINTAGYLLRYFSLDTYFIFLGFRFHISFLLFLILFINKDFPAFVKSSLVHSGQIKIINFILIVLLPSILIGGSLLLMKEVKVAKPENFYELGISSLLDFPVYLIWNFPGLAVVMITILFFIRERKKSFLLAALLFFIIYVFEIIPIDFEDIDFFPMITFIFISLSIGVLINRFRNIYFLSVLIFTIIWVWILAFGSNDKLLINFFLASQYENWDGFFSVGKSISDFLTPAAVLIFFLIALIVSFFSNKERSQTISSGS